MTNAWYQTLYLRRAKRMATVFAWVPFLSMVALSGSVARGVAEKESDIDLFVVTRPGRLFTVRLLVVMLARLFRLHRHGDKKAGRLCFNRFQDAESLEILPQTHYHAVDLSKIIPLVDLAAIYPKYTEANQWMSGDFGEQFSHPLVEESRLLPLIRWIQKPLEWLLAGRLGDYLERLARSFQVSYMEHNPETKDFRNNIVVSDTRLLFHPRPGGVLSHSSSAVDIGPFSTRI